VITPRLLERVLRDRTTALAYRLGNLRDALGLLLELAGPGGDARARSVTRSEWSEPAVRRWADELVMVAWWVSYATLRLLDDVDCPELARLNACRCQLLGRAAAMLRRRGFDTAAAELLALHDLGTLPDCMRVPC
jgi:hypothetical protein